jgi:hypothetical protein
LKHYESLASLRDDLRAALPDEAKFDFVAIRLMLRTGINIKQPGARHLENPLTIARVLGVISALGIELAETNP